MMMNVIGIPVGLMLNVVTLLGASSASVIMAMSEMEKIAQVSVLSRKLALCKALVNINCFLKVTT